MADEGRLAMIRAYSVLANVWHDTEAAHSMAKEPVLTTEWARIFRWEVDSDNRGLVISVHDVQRAWPIHLAPSGAADLATFAAEYSASFRRSFDPSASRPVPSPALQTCARVLASRTTGFLSGTVAFLGMVSLVRAIWPDPATWATILAGLAVALAVSLLMGWSNWVMDRHLAHVLRRELAMSHYAHLLRPLEQRYEHFVGMVGVRGEVSVYWADELARVREVLARNRFEDLPVRLATVMEWVRTDLA